MQQVYEYAGNLHIHTPYSDGHGSHADIAHAAINAGLDFVVVTDHNIWVDGVQGYYGPNLEKRVLLLTGEEVHDMRRYPQVNHLLVYDTNDELAAYAADPQTLINEVNKREGLSFIAHPNDPGVPLIGQNPLPWVDWDVEGYTGLEIWNYMSDFTNYLDTKLKALQVVLNPDKYISGPAPETLKLWDRLLAEGQHVNVIGNSDAHAGTYSLGPIGRVVFPYEHLFRCVNTHILTMRPFSGDIDHDSTLIYQALRGGRAFVGYDWPASTKGFRFSAQGHNTTAVMGGTIRMGHGVTLQMVSPLVADMRLIYKGEVVAQEVEGTHRTFIASEPGAYRVEIYIEHEGKPRGWIFSNPIYVVK